MKTPKSALESWEMKLSIKFLKEGNFFTPPQNGPNPKISYIFPRTPPNVLISYPNHILNVLSPFLNLFWCYRHFSALPELKNVSRWLENDVFRRFLAHYTCFQPNLRLKWVTLADFASLVYPSIFRISSRFCARGSWTFINVFSKFEVQYRKI